MWRWYLREHVQVKAADPCSCWPEYPVDIKRARKAFNRACRELAKAKAEVMPVLKADDARRLACDARYRENERILHGYNFGSSFSAWNGYEHSLLVEISAYTRLKEFADRVRSLSLTRIDVGLMCLAEKTDFVGNWRATAERIKAHPAPEPPPLAEKPSSAQPTYELSPPLRRASIWDSIFGTDGV